MPQRLPFLPLFLLSDFHVVALSVWRRPCVAFLPFCVSLRIFFNPLVLIDITEPRLLFQPLSSEAKEGPSGFEIEASFLRNSQRLPLVACSSLSVLSWLPSASAPCSASHPPESKLALSCLPSSFDSASSWPRLSRSQASPLLLPLAVAFVCGQIFSINASVSALII